jgi:hypothetical protein
VKKVLWGLLIALSLTSVLLCGRIIAQGTIKKSQNLVVEFKSSARFEIVYTHEGVSESISSTGIHEVYISRNLDEHWGIYFIVQKQFEEQYPVYVSIMNLDRDVLYSTVVSASDGYLAMDCKYICDKTSST